MSFQLLVEIVLIFIASVLLGAFSDVSDIDRSFYFSDNNNGGYHYPSPIPPVHYDEPIPILPPSYLPPLPPIFSDEVPQFPPSSGYLPAIPPSNDIFPPPSADSVVIPAPPSYPGSGVYPPYKGLLPPHFKIEKMSCIEGMNFKSVFRVDNPSQFPVIDDLTSSASPCITPMKGNLFRIDLDDFESMLKCGVKRCSGGFINSNVGQKNNMCVVVRMPTVKGVRLPEDEMVTLMCTPQERVVSETKHIKLGSSKIIQTSRARSNTAFVAAGGTQKDLQTSIGIFRKRPGTNIFDQNVQPDSIIQLGEDLMLRATVNQGDGWKNSHIGPVVITGLNSKKSALLVNQLGCINPIMRSICPKQPQKINSLMTEIHFRAFLFQESPQGDEMVVSVRTQGCHDPQDCLKTESCLEDNNNTRTKRELNLKSSAEVNDTISKIDEAMSHIKNWESELFFKVEPRAKRNQFMKDNQNTLHLVIITVICTISSILAIFLLLWLVRLKINQDKY